jgi:hypothetical protein
VVLQSVAPHCGIVAEHEAVQQWPVPVVPHLPLVQLVLDEHEAPSASWLRHVPEAPGFWQKKPDVQSLSEAQAVLQEVELAQMKFPAQAAGVPATHAFDPLQAPGVSVEPLHVGGQSPFTLHCTQPSAALHFPVGGMHPTGAGGLHAPAPLQAAAGLKTLPTQAALEQPVDPPG